MAFAQSQLHNMHATVETRAPKADQASAFAEHASTVPNNCTRGYEVCLVDTSTLNGPSGCGHALAARPERNVRSLRLLLRGQGFIEFGVMTQRYRAS